MGFLRTVLGRMADLVWPRVCAVETCSRLSDRPDRHICSHCLATLPFHERGGTCRVCGGLVVAGTSHDFVCETCEKEPPAYEFARSAVRYEEPIDLVLKGFKYRHATWLCEDLVDLLEGAVRAKLDFAAIDAILPVPLHPNRLRKRGFNQSELLADSLSRRLNRRLDTHALSRIRDTEHQARLSGEERRMNLKGAFAVPDSRYVRGRTLLVVDDVMTSGTTLTSCARALREAGASRVWCATVARAIMK